MGLREGALPPPGTPSPPLDPPGPRASPQETLQHRCRLGATRLLLLLCWLSFHRSSFLCPSPLGLGAGVGGAAPLLSRVIGFGLPGEAPPPSSLEDFC